MPRGAAAPRLQLVRIGPLPVTFPITARTEVRRLPARGSYDVADAYAILDEGLVAHVAFVAGGHPFVIPTAYARVDDTLVIHGSPASRLLRSLARGVDVCVTVTLLDGLVLARSTFHHSMNYRSVVVVGTAVEVVDPETKRRALDAFVEHVVPGRTAEARPPSEKELRGTLVLAVALTEVSVKRRTGPPLDDAEDLGLDVWAGELPLRTVPGDPVADVVAGARAAPPPAYVTGYRRSS